MRFIKAAMRRYILPKMGFRFHQPPPIRSRDWRYSVLSSLDDEPYGPSERLILLTADAIRKALDISLADIAAREQHQENRSSTTPRTDVNFWPGEHYRLIAALVSVTQAKRVVEIGTHRGLSALAMRETLPAGGVVTTYDIQPWDSFKDTCLRASDLEDGRIVMHADNLAEYEIAEKHRAVLERADLIFIDGPHDGVVERRIMSNLIRLSLKEGMVFVFDDIRLWEMLSFWRELALPKLDITSFGHWSGTGIAEWSRPTVSAG